MTNWISDELRYKVTKWGLDNWDEGKTQYQNYEDLLEMLHVMDRATRGKRSMEDANFLGAAYEMIQKMREEELARYAAA